MSSLNLVRQQIGEKKNCHFEPDLGRNGINLTISTQDAILELTPYNFTWLREKFHGQYETYFVYFSSENDFGVVYLSIFTSHYIRNLS